MAQTDRVDMAHSGYSTVNEHYLDHVMTVAEERQVEATEDIFAENGMKLLAKGHAINSSMRDRLLEHKLIKPLEDCMAVSDGVTGARCASVAQQMLDTYPVLRAMSDSGHQISPVQLMADSAFAGRLQTLLTVYNEHRPGKLEHAICVSLLALSLRQRMRPHVTEGLDVLLVASLAHDVGELYIDPAYLDPQARLTPKEWRHIAAHPVIAHDLLKDLSGLAKPAATLILDHHERMDGFGYPRGLKMAQVSDEAQILAVAEMLGGMLNPHGGLLQQADVAVKLIYGEFSRPIIDVVSSTFHACEAADAISLTDARPEGLRLSLELGRRLDRTVQLQQAIKPLIERASPAFKQLWAQAQERFERIRRAWSSTGLDVQPDSAWLSLEPEPLQREVAIILKEIHWRLKELERELRARVAHQAAGDLPLLERYFLELDRAADHT